MLGAEPWIRHVRLAGLTNLLLGAFLIRLPAALSFPRQDGSLQRNFVIVGGLIMVCSTARIFLPQRSVVPSVVTLICGIWILLSPVTLRSAVTWQLFVESLAAGLALIAFAWWSISESLCARDWAR